MIVKNLCRRIFYGLLVGIVIWIIGIGFKDKLKQNEIQPVKVKHRVSERNIDLLRPTKTILVPHLKQKDVFLVTVVLSSPNHFDRRQAIRSTWGNHSFFNATDKSSLFQVFFLLGQSNETQHNILENRQYNDIVLGDFNDNYYSLVTKTFLGLRWAMKDVNFKYLLKCDDDVYLNIPRLLKWLHSEAIMLQHNLYAGHINKDVIPVRKNYKNALSESEYPRDVFPPYAAGPVYILSRSSVQLILEASREVKPFFIEDAYLGCLAEHAGIHPLEMEIFVLDFDTNLKFLDYGTCKLLSVYVFGHNLSPSYMKQLHKKVMQFEALDRDVAGVVCLQQKVLHIYKVSAVIVIVAVSISTLMCLLVFYFFKKRSKHRLKRPR